MLPAHANSDARVAEDSRATSSGVCLKPSPPSHGLSPPFAPMPASGLQALLMWMNCEAMRLGTDRFSAEAIAIRVNPDGQYTYVGLYFQLVNWSARMRSWCHITLLSRCVGILHFTTDQLRRFEAAAARLLREPLFLAGTFAGDTVPIFTDDGTPHRLILHVHVRCLLAARLWSLRQEIWSILGGPGEVHRRVNFHLSVDRTEGDIEN